MLDNEVFFKPVQWWLSLYVVENRLFHNFLFRGTDDSFKFDGETRFPTVSSR